MFEHYTIAYLSCKSKAAQAAAVASLPTPPAG